MLHVGLFDLRVVVMHHCCLLEIDYYSFFVVAAGSHLHSWISMLVLKNMRGSIL